MSSLHEEVIIQRRGPIYRARRGMTRKLKDICSREAYEIWNYITTDKPVLPFLIPVVLFAWILERWVVPFSNWVPLCVTVWATIQVCKISNFVSILFYYQGRYRDADIWF